MKALSCIVLRMHGILHCVCVCHFACGLEVTVTVSWLVISRSKTGTDLKPWTKATPGLLLEEHASKFDV